MQCCLDSEGYAIVLKTPESNSNIQSLKINYIIENYYIEPSQINIEKIKEEDIYSVLNADLFLQFITESN